MPPEIKKELVIKDHFVKEIVKFTLIALAIVIPVRAYVAQPFIVSGASMNTTFENGQYLIVDQISYDLEAPARGEVIIFRYPRDPKTFFIKRIIGLPGETVESAKGVLTIKNSAHPEGFTLSEPYVQQDSRTYDDFTTTLGPTEYFVMGDNRAQSSDSRFWGPLDRKLIIGRPLLRLFPFDKAAIFPGRQAEAK